MLAGCASGPKNPSAELVQRIEAARTRGDHEALVATYVQEATAARTKAAEHSRMAKSYQGMGVGGKGIGSNMPLHCKSLVTYFESIATEYDGLAGDHRKLAETAPL